MKPEELAGGKLLLDEPAEAVARLTLNRPDSRNALDHELLNALAEVMPTLDRGIEIRCVLLTAAGGIFSAGYDIAAFSDETFETEGSTRWPPTPGRWSAPSTATRSAAGWS
jgi:enoyl-CoA hydratase/carnithine racemase